MRENIKVGDRVKIQLDSEYWQSEGWYEGTVVRIDPYSAHRRFFWVELDVAVRTAGGGSTQLVSVLNPKRIVKADGAEE